MTVRRWRRAAAWVGAGALVAIASACSGGTAAGDEADAAATTPPAATVVTAAATTTTAPASTAPATTASATTTTEASTTAPPTTAPPTTAPAVLETRQIGTSIEGRPIVAERRGTPGGTVVLVVGVIHGNEDDGLAVLEDLRELAVPDGIDLWLLDAMNPDGQANQVRGNANAVDLNRNFPHDWQPIGEPGLWEYSGSGPASEPETQAFIAFTEEIQPALTIWYHQDLFRISPGQGLDGEVRARYAELTGLPLLAVTGGTYTGVAATWQRRTLPEAIAFIVELGETLEDADAAVHAAAVLDVAGIVAKARTGG